MDLVPFKENPFTIFSPFQRSINEHRKSTFYPFYICLRALYGVNEAEKESKKKKDDFEKRERERADHEGMYDGMLKANQPFPDFFYISLSLSLSSY